jgi:hypothetical protein
MLALALDFRDARCIPAGPCQRSSARAKRHPRLRLQQSPVRLGVHIPTRKKRGEVRNIRGRAAHLGHVRRMLRETPWRELAKPGEASRVLRAAARTSDQALAQRRRRRAVPPKCRMRSIGSVLGFYEEEPSARSKGCRRITVGAMPAWGGGSPMKLIFRGWKREVKSHSHQVTAVRLNAAGAYVTGRSGDPMEWNGAFSALGRVSGLALSGTFLIEFTFEEQELRSWLEHYAKSNPAFAIRLLAEMQAEALIALNGQRSATL